MPGPSSIGCGELRGSRRTAPDIDEEVSAVGSGTFRWPEEDPSKTVLFDALVEWELDVAGKSSPFNPNRLLPMNFAQTDCLSSYFAIRNDPTVTL